MPTLTRYFIKIAMVYLALALVTALALSAQSPLNLPSELAVLRPVYFHLFMLGWVTELIFGVAYWMFPKFSKDRPRRSERLGWAVFILLNVGLVLRVIGEPLTALQPQLNAGWILALSAVLQLIAGWGFIFNTWDRVKER
jgi:heme/copper-type cytochrome/quinol oxidase subunit 1